MPPRIPGVSFADAFRLFRRFGWEFSHQNGSHVHMVNSDGSYITIPRYDQRDISANLLGQIVEDAGLDHDHFCGVLGAPTGTGVARHGVGGRARSGTTKRAGFKPAPTFLLQETWTTTRA